MTEYEHTTVNQGFEIDPRPIMVPGKRRWYAPWLRHPAKSADLSDLFETAIAQSKRRLHDD